jgi:hypothetical protein
MFLGMNRQRKPTFYQLRLAHSVNIYELSRESHIPSLTIWSMLIGQEVTPYEAQTVLDALNTLRNTHYTLTDVEIALTSSVRQKFYDDCDESP